MISRLLLSDFACPIVLRQYQNIILLLLDVEAVLEILLASQNMDEKTWNELMQLEKVKMIIP